MINRTLIGSCLTVCLATPVFAEPGRVPNAQGKFYVSVEGGFQKSDGSSVAAHGDLSTQDDFNEQSAAAAGVLAQPSSARSIRVNEIDGANQINDEESLGGVDPGDDGVTTGDNEFVSIEGISTTDISDDDRRSRAETFVASDALGFIDAFAAVFDDASNEFAVADAFGGPAIKAEDSGYVGLTIGYGFIHPLYGLFDRIEGYGLVSTTATQKLSVDGAAAAISVDGTSAFAAAVIIPDDFTPIAQDFGEITTDVKQSVDFAELGFRLKADRWNYGSALLTAGFEGFYVHYGQDTVMNASVGGAVGDFIGTDFFRSSEIEGDLFGPILSLEAQLPLEGTSLSLIGRGFGGFYYLNADGQFDDNFGVSAVNDDQSEWGYRVGLEAGLRMDLSQNTFFSVTGAIDHFSDIPTAVLPTSNDLVPAHVDTDDLTNYKVGARLTFVLSGN